MNDMYTILINEDHTFTHSRKKRIMYRSNLIDSIRFLVKKTYNDLDMTKVNAVIEYRTPISKKYSTIVLKQSDELYKNRVEFILPIDLKFTSEIGELEFTINFSYLSMNEEDGTFKEYVRPIGKTSILIEDTVHWSDYIANSNLDNIAQIMLKNQSLLEEQKAYAEMIAYERADGIAKDEKTNEIYLTAQGKEIGNRIKDSIGCGDKDGVPVIDLTSEVDSDIPNIPDKEEDDVIEF